MTAYILFFLFVATLAYISDVRKPVIGNQYQSISLNLLWLSLFFFLCFFIGFRHEVGGDWGAYLNYFYQLKGTKFIDGFSISSDPGYLLINWSAAALGFDIYTVNLLGSIIFSTGLIFFCRSLPRPLLALLASIPYMIIVVSMGYSRQGIALGFVMIALVLLARNRRLWFIFFVLLATSFHKTAIIMLPIAALATSQKKILIFFWILIIGLAAYFSAFLSQIERLFQYYVQEEYQSEGAFIRLLMLFLPSLILLLWPHRFKIHYAELRLWKICALLSMSCFVLLFVSDSSTAIDRVALYLLPLQLVVFSYLPEFFGNSGEQRQLIVFGVIIYYLAVLFVWLNFAFYSIYWIPYNNLFFNWS
jgi:hypothetical protein